MRSPSLAIQALPVFEALLPIARWRVFRIVDAL